MRKMSTCHQNANAQVAAPYRLLFLMGTQGLHEERIQLTPPEATTGKALPKAHKQHQE